MAEINIETVNELIKNLKKVNFINTKNISDRYYTIGQLYEYRLVLFKILCYTYPHLSWKTKEHFDGSMFNNSFLAGITTPLGNATYHFKSVYFDEFDVTQIDRGPQYDGYNPDDVINRINSLPLLGNNYINTGKCLIHTVPKQLLNSSINLEDINKSTKLMNDLISLLRSMHLISTADISDDNHTFRELYKQKRESFKLICHNYNDLAWKSRTDINGEPISEDTFMVGLFTPLGPVCFVLNDEHYNEFNVEELNHAPILGNEIYTGVIEKLCSVKIRQMNQ